MSHHRNISDESEFEDLSMSVDPEPPSSGVAIVGGICVAISVALMFVVVAMLVVIVILGG